MACVPRPEVPMPELGGGLSIAPPALPPFSGDLNSCCKEVALSIPLPPIPLPPFVLNAAVNLAIASALKTIEDFIDALAVRCPRE